MSESSEDKTRREYIKSLLSYPWRYQTSIFFSIEGSQFLLEEMRKIKLKIKYHYRSYPLLFRVAILQKGVKRTARISILSISEVPDFDKKLKKWLTPEKIEDVQARKISDRKLMQTAKTIKTKAPHNLKLFFGKAKVNRISLLHEDQLPEPNENNYLEFLKGLKDSDA